MPHNGSMTTTQDYFLAATNERSVRAIALFSGLEPSRVNRQLTGTNALTIETVVTICRAYKLDLADAFVAAGFITPDEAAKLASRAALADFTDLQIAREIVRRLEAGEAGDDLTNPLTADDEIDHVDTDVTVYGLAADRGVRAADKAPHAD